MTSCYGALEIVGAITITITICSQLNGHEWPSNSPDSSCTNRFSVSQFAAWTTSRQTKSDDFVASGNNENSIQLGIGHSLDIFSSRKFPYTRFEDVGHSPSLLRSVS